MTPDAPTLGELMRVVVDIRQQLTDMRQQAAEREKLFVRADVFEARQASDAIQLNGLEKEVHSVSKRLDAAEERARSTRWLVWSSLIAPLLVGLVLAAVLAGGAPS